MIKTRVLASVLVLGLMASVLALVPALAADNDGSVGVADRTTGIWYLRSPGGQTTSFFFGNPGDYPIMGDWNCDGIDTPGLYRQSDGYVYLRNSNTQGPADVRFFFGDPGDIPLAGDFDDDGCDTVSIYRPAEARVFVINELGSNDGGLGAADFAFYFGDVGDKPFTADFDNDGIDEVGLHRESTGFVYYRNSLTTGIADNEFFYGDPGDQIISGRWVQNLNPGPDTVGIFRPSQGQFYLRFSNSQGNADAQFPYGNSNMAAVAGRFGSLPGGDAPPPTVPPTTVTTTPAPATTTTTTAPTAYSIDLVRLSYYGDWSGYSYGQSVYLARGREGSLWTGNLGSKSVSLKEELTRNVWSGFVGLDAIDLVVTPDSNCIGLTCLKPAKVTGWIGSRSLSLSQNLDDSCWSGSTSSGYFTFCLSNSIVRSVNTNIPSELTAIVPMLFGVP